MNSLKIIHYIWVHCKEGVERDHIWVCWSEFDVIIWKIMKR